MIVQICPNLVHDCYLYNVCYNPVNVHARSQDAVDEFDGDMSFKWEEQVESGEVL